jgi:hypothetical protein
MWIWPLAAVCRIFSTSRMASADFFFKAEEVSTINRKRFAGAVCAGGRAVVTADGLADVFVWAGNLVAVCKNSPANNSVAAVFSRRVRFLDTRFIAKSVFRKLSEHITCRAACLIPSACTRA